MKLQNAGGNKTPPKVKPKERKEKDSKGLPIYRSMTYEYSLNEEVYINASGKKQITNLKKPYYRVTKVYLKELGDMSCWLMCLNEEDDINIVNPYLAHHFSPKNKEENEGT